MLMKIAVLALNASMMAPVESLGLRNLISRKLQSSNGRDESEETPLSVINDKSLDIATSLKWEGRSFIGDDKSSSDNDGDQSKETPLSIINVNNHPNVIKEDPVAIINDKL